MTIFSTGTCLPKRKSTGVVRAVAGAVVDYCCCCCMKNKNSQYKIYCIFSTVRYILCSWRYRVRLFPFAATLSHHAVFHSASNEGYTTQYTK